MALANSTLANAEQPSTSDEAKSFVADPEKDKQDATAVAPVAGTEPAPRAPLAEAEKSVDAANNAEQDENEYPTGIKQALIVFGVLLGTFPVSLDFVSALKFLDAPQIANLPRPSSQLQFPRSQTSSMA